MIHGDDLPTVNAALNATSALLLTTGYVFIRRGRVVPHAVCMLTATGVSALFLASYLYYHFAVKAGTPTEFVGPDWVRFIYLYLILLPHTLLAAAMLPMILLTLYRACRRDWPRHVRIARWTLPIWLYVSITGVIVYLMLYHIYAP